MTSSMNALLAPAASPIPVSAAHSIASSGFDDALLGAMAAVVGTVPMAIPAATTSQELTTASESAAQQAVPIPTVASAPAANSVNLPPTPDTEVLAVPLATVTLAETTPIAPISVMLGEQSARSTNRVSQPDLIASASTESPAPTDVRQMSVPMIAAPDAIQARPNIAEPNSLAAAPTAATVAAIAITATASITATSSITTTVSPSAVVSTINAASPTGAVAPTATPSTAPAPVPAQSLPAVQTAGSITVAASVATPATPISAAATVARASGRVPLLATAVAPAPVAPSDASVPAPILPAAPSPAAIPPVTTPVAGQAVIGAGVLASRAVSRQPIASLPVASVGAPAGDSIAIAPPLVAVPVQIPAPVITVLPPAAPAAPSAPPTFATQVSVPVFTLVGGAQGEHTLTVNVAPDNLGPVTVRAHITADGIRVQLFAPTDAGRDALRAILPDLRRDLAGSGLDASLDLSSRNEPDDSRGGESRRDWLRGISDISEREHAEPGRELPVHVRNPGTATTLDVTV
jgi:flagellar hook-length control protein FliK